MKFATTDILLDLADEARVADFNRQFPMPLVDALDPQGIHICSFGMIHEHADGREVNPHMRTKWLLKIKDSMEPLSAFLDIPMDSYEGKLFTEEEMDRVQALREWANAQEEKS